jgi:S1-C subfamily serine protease
LARYLKIPDIKGIIVTSVEPKSPAQKAGLQESDIILSIGNKKINSVGDYQSVAKNLAAGNTLEAEFWRNGEKKTAVVKTRVFPIELADDLAYRILGIKVGDLTRKNRRRHQISAREGVMISGIKKNSYLADIGARPGDVIRQIDDYSIENSNDFKKAIIKFRNKNSVVLLLQRGDQGYYITVTL